jgi:hypothetical protein
MNFQYTYLQGKRAVTHFVLENAIFKYNYPIREAFEINLLKTNKQTNSVTLSPRANYTD